MNSRTKYFVVSTSTCLTVLLLVGHVIGRAASADDTYKHIGVFSGVVARIQRVEVTVFHVRKAEPTTVKLTRVMIPLPAVETRMLANNIGYINVDALSSALVKEVAAGVLKLQSDGAKKLMLDVRNCATGSPEDGIALANLFLNKGRITYLVGQKVPRQNFEADAAKAITTLPMTVLTNRRTADAAEVAAPARLDSNA